MERRGVVGSSCSKGSRGRGYKGRGQRVKEWTSGSGGVYRRPLGDGARGREIARSEDLGDKPRGVGGGGVSWRGGGRGLAGVEREIEQKNKIKTTITEQARNKTVDKKKSDRIGSGPDESYDSSGVERLDRYLCAQFNIEFDSDGEDDEGEGFLLSCDEPTLLLTELSSRDCLHGNPTPTHLPASSLHPPPPSSSSSITEPVTSTESRNASNRVSNNEQCGRPDFAQFDDTSDQSEDETVKLTAIVGRSGRGNSQPVSARLNDPSDQCEDGPVPIGQLSTVQVTTAVRTVTRSEEKEEEEEEEDDGWNSDNSDFRSQFPSHSVPQPVLDLPPYAMYEDDVWVDEAKAIFSKHKKEDSKELEELFHEMFTLNTDVYSLMLAFVRRAGKTRQPPKSLVRLAITAFQKWLKKMEREGPVTEAEVVVEEKEGRIPNPPVLTVSHQEEVLELMTRSHLNLIEDLCKLFHLHSIDTRLLVDLVDTLLSQGKRKEAVTYAWTFQLQSHFPLDDMLLPLIAMDKINLVESYIGGDRGLQEDFVMLLDRLSCSGGLASYAKRLDLDASAPNSKLCSKQLFKMALRLVKMFNLQLAQFPGLSSQRLIICLHHLLRMRYILETITEDNMADLVAAAVQAHPSLPQLLVRELIRMGQREAAAHWAIVYHLPSHILPIDVQILTAADSSLRSRISQRIKKEEEEEEEEEPSSECLQLSLPLDCIHFVNDPASLEQCRRRMTQEEAIIGIDAEWRLPICNGWDERMALLQLAVSDSVYLLDMLALPLCVPHSQLTSFISDIFSNTATIKLGYSITGDLDLLGRSWPFVASVLKSPARVVDIKTLATMVGNMSVKPVPPPPHPLLLLPSSSSQHPTHRLLVKNPSNFRPLTPLQTPTTQNHRPPKFSEPRFPRSTQKQPSPHIEDKKKEKYEPPHRKGSPVLGDPEEDDPLNSESTRGLSKLVQIELGRPLDKSQQISDWEKRPLSRAQLRYAALDALCLLELYTILSRRGVASDPEFNTEPCIPPLRLAMDTSSSSL